MEGVTQVPVVVTEEFVTPKAARPSVLDHSRYDISEARVGEMVVRVYRQPIIRGRAHRRWCFEVEWRGREIWHEIVLESQRARSAVEEEAAWRAQRLASVVEAVGDMLAADARAATQHNHLDRAAPSWIALPEESAE